MFTFAGLGDGIFGAETERFCAGIGGTTESWFFGAVKDTLIDCVSTVDLTVSSCNLNLMCG